MKIVFVGMKYDYGDKSLGLSGNEVYFVEPIKQLGHSVIEFDFLSKFQENGKNSMNSELLNLVKNERPDITLFVPFKDEFIPETIQTINDYTTTIGYFFDDTWRINYSRFWSHYYTYVTTSDVNGIRKWKELGCRNFLYIPFSVNTNTYIKLALPKRYDVTFVGGYHPYRSWIIRQLNGEGIRAAAWGQGWKNGRVDLRKMIEIFNESKINLNMSNNRSYDLRFLASLKRPLKETLRLWRDTGRSLFEKDVKIREMVKARHFEINACGGFQLTYYVEGLERHFTIGEDVSVYESFEDLLEKVRYFLKYEEEREIIAKRGHERTLRDHSAEKRFSEMLSVVEVGK